MNLRDAKFILSQCKFFESIFKSYLQKYSDFFYHSICTEYNIKIAKVSYKLTDAVSFWKTFSLIIIPFEIVEKENFNRFLYICWRMLKIFVNELGLLKEVYYLRGQIS